jgi:inorganic pyrophosphatase
VWDPETVHEAVDAVVHEARDTDVGTDLDTDVGTDGSAGGDAGGGEFEVVVEIPRGSRNKYEMDHARHRIRLDRTLYTATRYPADYGYIEGTLARDGDPLDALVLVGEPTWPGCVIRCRAVGVYVMSDENGPDEKVLCVPARDPRYADRQDVDDISPFGLREISHFFEVYKDLEPGKHVTGHHWAGREAAYAEIAASRARAAAG